MPRHPTILETPSSGELFWSSEAGAQALARRWAAADLRQALANAFIELRGDLGAGKTTFTRHLLRALGVTGRIKSPTYAVLESYQVTGGTDGGPLDIHHFDFYRFDDPREWEDAGFRDLFAQAGLKLAEWPDKAQGWLPMADLRMDIRLMPDTHPVNSQASEAGGDADSARHITLTAHTPVGEALLAAARGCASGARPANPDSPCA